MSTAVNSDHEAARIARETLIHNEKTKLLATWKNGISIALGLVAMFTLPTTIIALEDRSPAAKFALFLLYFVATIGFFLFRNAADKELNNLR